MTLIGIGLIIMYDLRSGSASALIASGVGSQSGLI
jgi:hypothetical protein